MTEQTNTPQLRFPEFKENWKKIELKNICNVTSSKRVHAKDYVKKGIPFFRGKEISNGAFKDEDDLLYISEDVYNEFSGNYGAPKMGELLITSVGTIGNVAIVPPNFKFYFKDGNLIWLKEIKINSYFLMYYLKSSLGQKRLLDKASGSNQKALTISGLESLKVLTTNNQEQKKMSAFFNELDQQIELEEQKLSLLEEQKKGYMQQIFSQELRFKDENGNDYPEWKTKKLDELGEFNSGVGFPEKYQGGNAGVPFFKISDMNLLGNEKFMNTANNYVSIEQINQKKWKVIQNVPAIIFAKVGAAIMLNRKRMTLNPFLIDNNTMSYSFSNHWDTNFGYVVFQTLNLPKYAQVGALPSYNSKDIGIIQIRLPIKEEQEKIGDFFKKIDELIKKQTLKIDGLKERKKGFLQKMFV